MIHDEPRLIAFGPCRTHKSGLRSQPYLFQGELISLPTVSGVDELAYNPCEGGLAYEWDFISDYD